MMVLGYLGPALYSTGLVGVLAALWHVAQMIYNVSLHPLAKYPGPKLAGATQWYAAWFDLVPHEGGQYTYEITRMHKKYGPIVRIGPNEIHISDPKFRDVLYAIGSKRNKVPYMAAIFGTPLSMFGSVQHDLHKLRRRPLDPHFSRKSVVNMESVVLKKVEKLSQGLHAAYKAGKDVRLEHAMIATIMDITTQYSFGKSADCLDDPDFSPYWTDMLVGVSELVPLARNFSGVNELAMSLPIWLIKMYDPLVAGFMEFTELVREQCTVIFDRWQSSKDEFSGSSKGKGIPTVFHEILRSDMPDHEKSIDRMTQDALTVVAAAAETTSTVLVCVIFHVASNPTFKARLQAELDSAISAPDELVGWMQLEKLPFLTALLKEGLRLSMPIPGRLPLVSPDAMQYGSYTIPAGTYVGMSAIDSMHNADIYPSPLEFIPDRWLIDDKEKMREMEIGFVPFSRGPRMCIGLNLAWANMYNIVGTVFRRFEVEAVNTDYDKDIRGNRDYFAAKPPKASRGATIRIVGERS